MQHGIICQSTAIALFPSNSHVGSEPVLLPRGGGVVGEFGERSVWDLICYAVSKDLQMLNDLVSEPGQNMIPRSDCRFWLE